MQQGVVVNRPVLNRHMVSAKSVDSGIYAAKGLRRQAEANRLNNTEGRLEAAWMWRAVVAFSGLVWAAVIWAVLAGVFTR